MSKFGLRLGIDRAIFFTVLTRGWSVSAGLISIYFVSRFLSPILQGYYYTFCSLIALQIFTELGLNFALIQFASHEMAQLSWTSTGTLSGNANSKRRLQSLFHFGTKWLSVVAVILVLLLLPAGFLFLKSPPEDTQAAGTALPWSLLVICTALNMIIAAPIAILEGCGKVADVAILRMWQSVLSALTVWLVLSNGGNLYALAANSLMLALVSLGWLWINFRKFLEDIYLYISEIPGLDWRREIWPFQWRIAISSLSGYFISQLFNPILFITHGPVVAGQMGMTMQVVGAINGVAISWISTKAPIYGNLIAKNKIRALDVLFFRGFFQSLGLLFVGMVCLLLCSYYLTSIDSPYNNRVLPTHLFAILAVAGIANHIVCSEAAYLRAHRQEPFMILSTVNGAVTSILALIMIPYAGAAGAVYSYAITATIIGAGWGTAIFLKTRKIFAESNLRQIQMKISQNK